jgi:CRISPR-associated protein Cas2
MYIVISYDIHNDKRRLSVHKTLKNYGDWIQYSVFECNLTKEQYLILRNRLDKLIKKEEHDSIRFYFLCEKCQKNAERIGGVMPRQEGPVVL